MKVAFFHGLESNANSEKSNYLKNNYDAWCPSMDYTNPRLFDETLKQIQEDKPDLLIGSSMGGWFAYCISTLTGIPTLLLNPAVQGRTMEPKVHLGNQKAKHEVVLGKNDIVIDPSKTKDWFKNNCKGTFTFHMENIGHRSPNPIMVKYLKLNESLNERKLPDFQYPWTIIASNKGNSRVQFTGSGDDYIVKFNSLNPKTTLCFFESDKLKSSKNGNNSISEVSKVLSTIQYIIEEYLYNNPKVTVYFVGASAPGENTEEGEMTKRGRVYLDLLKDNIKPGFHWKISDDGVGMLIALKEVSLTESVNEDWSTESPGEGASINILGESIIDNLRHNFLASRPAPGNLTVENGEIDSVISYTAQRNEEDIRMSLSVSQSPIDEFYKWLIVRGQSISYSEIKSLWSDETIIKIIISLKDYYKRPRPYTVADIDVVKGTESESYSFPSGHALGAYHIAINLGKKFPHLEDGLIGLANRISWSRVKSGVHYPSDIEAGKELAYMIDMYKK